GHLCEQGVIVGDRDDISTRVHEHLARLYDAATARTTAGRLVALLDRYDQPRARPQGGELFDETDVVLIAYGDMVTEPGVAPLETLRGFLRHHTQGHVPGLHLLPHYPSTSDDGFAVADYAAVDPSLGTWADVERLGADFRLMLDAVLNHTSASHPWFTGWLRDEPSYADFYLALDPTTDLGAVTRPRTSPLLTEFEAVGGSRHVWTTFSADQVDLNYANPEVLLAVTAQLLDYVVRGARLLRLDAIAFLWKEPGTSCIHLPQTHEVVRLWRTVLDAVAPGTLLVTETNVPHEQNLTYFGAGDDEAHLVYQFALPPLTLAAFHGGDATTLSDWASSLAAPSEGTSFLNFLASHDGIGVRPVEGILSREEVEDLAVRVAANGGRVSYRAGVEGRMPYELNSVYLDALAEPGDDPCRELDRFLSAHSIMLALAGVPLVYFHSLFGSRNWTEDAERSGGPRMVNRQRFARAGLDRELADPTSQRRQVLDRMLDRIDVRRSERAFHPNAAQQVLDGGPSYFGVQRTPAADDTTVVCLNDVSGKAGRFRGRPGDRLPGGVRLVDLCDGQVFFAEPDGMLDVPVDAYGVRWLRVT
ncbi:MAG: sugar phosphorylase, partial [Nocardioides sp.]